MSNKKVLLYIFIALTLIALAIDPLLATIFSALWVFWLITNKESD